MKATISKSNFKVLPESWGAYSVTYTSNGGRDTYKARITDMELIDKWREDYPSQRSLMALRDKVKSTGKRYEKQTAQRQVLLGP